ncbi:MAG: D-alanyl-D-alanine carboxypeptidase [Deltaproteobacteria bacterium]|nr:MAG: D-alanyl-D-alanine carboxypeptidase [Deltaproteobacteria bacterium]
MKAPVKSDPRPYRRYFRRWIWGVCLLLTLSGHPSGATSARPGDNPLALIGATDSLLVTAPDGTVVFSRHADRQMIPASTLKLLTSLAALHYLGPDYRFPTEFFIDADRNLKIKGYGDPLLISEAIDRICKSLAGKLPRLNNIILDDHYFSQPVIIPGRTTSHQPFDAPNGALCANFNTVVFKKNRAGQYISAEKQTPLVPFARQKLRAAGLTAGRIVFSHRNNDNVLYAGYLFRHFLTRYGVSCRGGVHIGQVAPASDRLILRHTASADLSTVIGQLLEFSNNFIANQLLIAMGASVYGPPGTLKKGISAVTAYAGGTLGLTRFSIVEGSGIARQNRISAREMMRVLNAFEPFRHLMRRHGREYYKTGTLTGIRTRAGYIESRRGGRYRFVVMMNTKGKSAEKVVRQLLKQLP